MSSSHHCTFCRSLAGKSFDIHVQVYSVPAVSLVGVQMGPVPDRAYLMSLAAGVSRLLQSLAGDAHGGHPSCMHLLLYLRSSCITLGRVTDWLIRNRRRTITAALGQQPGQHRQGGNSK